MSKLIFGCGYLGLRVAIRWRDEGHDVVAVTRSANRAAQFRELGLRPLVADLMQPESLSDLPRASSILCAVGFDRHAAVSLRDVYVSGLRNVLDALPRCDRLLYISSTGVYGQNDGGWVDEHSPCLPTREGGRACLAAEQLLAEHPLGERSIVLRLAGIYGPGRVPRREELRAGQPLAAPTDGYLNLIHVDDAVSVVLAAEEKAAPPRTYLVADGSPVTRREYYYELARLYGAPEPRFASAPSDSPAAQRAAGDKRICNTRMRDELGIGLRFPSFREGLVAILAAETTSK